MNPQAPSPVTYTVQQGDTANSIAPKHGFSNYKTAGISGFKSGNPDLITPGEVLTIGGTPPTNNLINTSTQSRQTFASNSSDLNAALAKISGTPTPENPNPKATTDGGPSSTTTTTTTGTSTNDPILSGLDTLTANSDAATKALIASTRATYQNQRNELTSKYDNYKRGLQQLGVETRAAESTPDLLAGHILKAGNDQLTKINDLNAKEAATLMDAQNAKTTNDFKTLEAKMTYLKQIKTEKTNAIKDMYEAINNSNKALAESAHYELYGAFQTLNPKDQEAFITEVAKRYKVSPLAVVQALQDEADKRSTADLKTKNSQSILDNRGKNSGGTSTAGLSKAQIAAGLAELKKTQGKDGFYDPYKYIAAFEAWPGSTKAFVAAYPITGVNPKSFKLLPAAFKTYLPKTSSGSSSSL